MIRCSKFYIIMLLLALILVLQIASLAGAEEEPVIFEDPQPYPTYELYGTMIDITPFISDIEAVNGINCTCVIYDGVLVKLP